MAMFVADGNKANDEKGVRAHQYPFLCFVRNKLFHGICLRMSKADLDCITSEGLVWRCQPCSVTRRKSLKFDSEAQEGYGTVFLSLRNCYPRHSDAAARGCSSRCQGSGKSCHRLGNKVGPNNTPPGIIVKKKHRIKKELSTRHINMAMDQAEYVNEALTPARRWLLAPARQTEPTRVKEKSETQDHMYMRVSDKNKIVIEVSVIHAGMTDHSMLNVIVQVCGGGVRGGEYDSLSCSRSCYRSDYSRLDKRLNDAD
ncbi:hypothetical protein J6590_028432 [Homalodisca vitripennis]|nr:hypothetical protein J6590_028432 [Homalodisca vitripennis]